MACRHSLSADFGLGYPVDKLDVPRLENEGHPKGSTNRVVRGHFPPKTIPPDAPHNQLNQRPIDTVGNPVEKMCKNDDEKD